MNIAIHARNFKTEFTQYVYDIFEFLTTQGIQISISSQLEAFLSQLDFPKNYQYVYRNSAEFGNMDAMLSIGGDGTLLESITYTADKETPILGINTGRLGFLATTAPQEVKPALENIIKGYYQLDERVLVSVESDKDIFDGINFGLNDFTITKRDTSSMIVVHTYINGEYLNSYWADGLIVSTPTGSTAYSLSCGGPVVLPESNNFIISPISPHNLNVRPLVISDNSVISFSIEGRGKNFLVSLDSRSRVIDAKVQIAVKKEKFLAKLIKFKDNNFLNTLRTKLNWGLDARN